MPEQPTVTREIVVPAERADVWDALTTDELLESWLAPHVELDPCEGGDVSVRYDDGEERSGTVEAVDPHERIAFRWERAPGEESTVEFRLVDVPAGTRVIVVETGAPADSGPHGGGWSGPLLRLGAFARRGIPAFA